jgi:hypothetical protein
LVTQFRQEMQAAQKAGNAAADPDKLLSPGNAFNAWLGVQVLRQVAGSMKGTITSARLFAALNHSKVDLSGAGLPVLDFSKPVSVPGFERLFNPVVSLTKWDSATSDFVATTAKPINVLDVFAALQKASGR